MAYTLSIVGGTTYATKKFQLLKRSQAYAKSVVRTPYTDSWFAVGDGRAEPTPYGVNVTITGATQDECIAALAELHTISLSATKLIVASAAATYEYNVDGIVSFAAAPRTVGYNITIEFALLSSMATNTTTNNEVLI